MASPRSRQAARVRARRRRAQQRSRRIAVLVFVGVLAGATLLLTAFGTGSPDPVNATAATSVAVDGRPDPVLLATVSNLRIQLPVAPTMLTQIGFHASTSGALTLTPHGRQANEGLLVRLWRRIAGTKKAGIAWYQLGGSEGAGTEVLDVGAPAGADVYAPVDGQIAAISSFVIDGAARGARIDIRPTEAPSIVLSLVHVEPDPSLTVGAPVRATTSRLGTVVDVAAVEDQALARFTNDEGNNVALEAHPAATILP